MDVLTITKEKRFSEAYYYLFYVRLKKQIAKCLNHGIVNPGYGAYKERMRLVLDNYKEFSHLLTYRVCDGM